VDASREPRWTNRYLIGRGMTIAGGSTEVGKNVIAERTWPAARSARP